MVAIGKKLSGKKKFKPKFTEKDFVKGNKEFGEKAAEKFINFLNKKISQKKIDLEQLKNLVGAEHEISKLVLSKSLDSKGSIVFIKDEKIEKNLSLKELWYLIEHGRKDRGVLPDPILRSSLDEFKKTYKKSYLKFLKK